MPFIPVILASQSPSRLALLASISIIPDIVIPADIDETPLSKELPRALALRLACQKANKIVGMQKNGYIIAADSVVAVGGRILPKALSDAGVAYSLNMLSGRRHKVCTGVNIVKVQSGHIIASRNGIVQTTVKVKRLTKQEINTYVQSQEGISKAGGYAIQGLAQFFIQFIRGSVSNVIGLPLFETRNMLLSLGYDCINNEINCSNN